MVLLEAIKNRHSVRSFTDQKIEGVVLEKLQKTIENCNKESGLHIQLHINEPETFSGMLAKFGRFRNVKNYIALVGKDTADVEEKCGYYGEKIVLEAQQLGLNTCWVAVTFNKKKSKKVIELEEDEKLIIVIALGYGVTQGSSHKVKPLEKLSNIEELSKPVPSWFMEGLKAAQLAPTAINQQKFRLELQDDTVFLKDEKGPSSKIDMGIVKYHFEIGAKNGNWRWKEEN